MELQQTKIPIEEMIGIWSENKQKYEKFCTSIALQLQQELPNVPADVIEKQAATSVDLAWPLDTVHEKGISRKCSNWANSTMHTYRPIKGSFSNPEDLPCNGRYVLRNATSMERTNYKNAQEDLLPISITAYASFRTLIDLLGITTPSLCIAYASSILYPAQISPNGNYVTALTPDEKKVALYKAGTKSTSQKTLLLYEADACKTLFFLTDTALYIRKLDTLYRDDLAALDQGNRSFKKIPISLKNIPTTSSIRPFAVSSDGSYIILHGTGKNIIVLTPEKTNGWYQQSVVSLEQQVERYALHLLDKTGLFVGIHTSAYANPTENRHVIVSLNKPHLPVYFEHSSYGTGTVSPCHQYIALQQSAPGPEVKPEPVTIIEVATWNLGSDYGVTKIGTTVPVDLLIGWSDTTGAPLIAKKGKLLNYIYNNPAIALRAPNNAVVPS